MCDNVGNHIGLPLQVFLSRPKIGLHKKNRITGKNCMFETGHAFETGHVLSLRYILLHLYIMFIYSILLKKWGYGNFKVTLG